MTFPPSLEDIDSNFLESSAQPEPREDRQSLLQNTEEDRNADQNSNMHISTIIDFFWTWSILLLGDYVTHC